MHSTFRRLCGRDCVGLNDVAQQEARALFGYRRPNVDASHSGLPGRVPHWCQVFYDPKHEVSGASGCSNPLFSPLLPLPFAPLCSSLVRVRAFLFNDENIGFRPSVVRAV